MTILGKNGTYPLSINRRITELLATSTPPATGFTIHGDIATIVANSINNQASQSGILTRISTNVGAESAAHISGARIYNRQKEPSLYCRFKLGSSADERVFIGLTDLDADLMTANPLINGNYAGLYINTITSSTFRTVRGSGAPTTVSLGVSINTGYHDLYMWLKKSGGGNSMILQLDSNARVEYTSAVPSSTAMLRYAISITTRVATSKNIEIGKLSVNSEI